MEALLAGGERVRLASAARALQHAVLQSGSERTREAWRADEIAARAERRRTRFGAADAEAEAAAARPGAGDADGEAKRREEAYAPYMERAARAAARAAAEAEAERAEAERAEAERAEAEAERAEANTGGRSVAGAQPARDAAAARLQARHRGRSARRGVRRQHASATVIQARQRGRRSRSRSRGRPETVSEADRPSEGTPDTRSANALEGEHSGVEAAASPERATPSDDGKGSATDDEADELPRSESRFLSDDSAGRSDALDEDDMFDTANFGGGGGSGSESGSVGGDDPFGA
jgi:hypothetical protein